MLESDWENHYRKLKSDVIFIRKSGGISQAKRNQLLDVTKQLDRSLKSIASSPMEYEVASSEIARRNVILQNVTKSIESMITDGGSSSLSAGSSTFTSFHVTGNSSNTNTINPMMLSTDYLLQRQKDQMKQQDSMIEDIEKGVDRLHVKAVHIGDTAKEQNKIIDDLDTNVDIAAEGLKEEAAHASVIKDKANVCYMYICAGVEVIILVVLLLLLIMN